MARPRIHVYGPSLKDTIEVGDRFVDSDATRLLTVTGKVYHDDLSLSYTFDVLGGRKHTATIHEKVLRRVGDYKRVFKTGRTLMTVKDKNGTP